MRSAALLAIACGASLLVSCTPLRLAGGPKWSERRPPIELPAATADHRGKVRLRFLLFGDSGTGKPEPRRVARQMAAECSARGGCDFALMAGDNIYYTGVGDVFDRRFDERFESVYAVLGRMDFWAIAGNHDWYRRHSVDSQVLYSAASERWRMPAHDYEVPNLPEWLHVYGLDTTRLERGRPSGQIERARQALCGRPGWRILFGHHPIYSSGVHADRRGVFPAIEERLLTPLVAECGVQLYLSGHDHHQEHLSAPGFDQIIQGAAAKLRRVKPVPERAAGVKQLAAESRLGFALLEATADSLELRFFGYSNRQEFGEFHCRHFDLDEFDEPALRSVACRRGEQG